MAKSTKPRKDWHEIKIDYINGVPLREMSEKYNISHPNIIRQSKKEGWGEHKCLIKNYDAVANKINDLVYEHLEEDPELKELQQKLHDSVLPSQISQVDKDVAMMGLYKANIASLQTKFAKVIEKSVSQVSEILDHHKDGLYTSSLKGDGSASYERTTRFLSDLAPFFAENNKVMGLTSAQVAIQNNVNANNDDVIDDQKVIINISGKK